MTPEQFVARVPRLYHLTRASNVEFIRRHGLLSTSALLDRFGVVEGERRQLETARRPTPVTLTHPEFGTVTLRDQHPLNAQRLAASLSGGMTVAEWLKLINARVFFFPDEERAKRLASVYALESQALLVFDTAEVLERYLDRVSLAHMNTGTTSPIAHPRGRDTFKLLADYPFEDRRQKYGRAAAVKEITVVGQIDDVDDLLVEVRPFELP